MLGQPYVIAKLQQDADDVYRAPLASEVFTLSRSRKRTRSEISLAIDGQSVNIYDVTVPLARLWQH